MEIKSKKFGSSSSATVAFDLLDGVVLPFHDDASPCLYSFPSVLRQIHPDLLGAAATLGGSPVYCFRKVILPLSLPGLIAGICFVFSMTVSAYVIPSLLTGAGFKTLSKVAADSYLVILNPVRGATVSLILLVIAFAAVFLAGRVVNRKPGQARA